MNTIFFNYLRAGYINNAGKKWAYKVVDHLWREALYHAKKGDMKACTSCVRQAEFYLANEPDLVSIIIGRGE